MGVNLKRDASCCEILYACQARGFRRIGRYLKHVLKQTKRLSIFVGRRHNVNQGGLKDRILPKSSLETKVGTNERYYCRLVPIFVFLLMLWKSSQTAPPGGDGGLFIRLQ